MLIGHAIHNYIIVLLALVEILVVLFVYGKSILLYTLFFFYIYFLALGYNRFANDIRLILGNKPNLFWKIVFLLSAPITVFVRHSLQYILAFNFKFISNCSGASTELRSQITNKKTQE